MPLSPGFGLAIMMNNYFHDLATALLLGSAVGLWVMVKRYQPADGPGAARYLLRLHQGLTRLARLSLLWILLGGVPRAIYFEDFEWANAVGKLQVPALIAKHVLIFAVLGAGVALWLRLRRKVAQVRAELEAQPR